MQKLQVTVGLDIGTTKVAVCAGTIQEGIINIIGFGSSPASGVRKGIIIDIEETVSAVTAALEEAERMSGSPITDAFVGISNPQITCTISKGVIAISRADGEITETDVQRVIEAARAIALPPNYQIIDVIPRSFIIDGQTDINDPIGMTGIRLEVEAHVIGASIPAIKTLSKCIEQSSLGISDLTFSPLASSYAILTKKQKEAGVALVDIGASTTSVAIFEDGDLLYAGILSIGSLHITNDIAIGLRTSLDVAEKIKIKYGSATPTKFKETEMVDLKDFDSSEEEKISKKYIAEIVEARLSEIFAMVRSELKKVGKDGMLPAGIVFTGGGSKIQGLLEAAKEELRLPAQIGYPHMEISGMIDKLDNPMYSTSVGLMLWGMNHYNDLSQSKFDIGKMGGVFDKVKGIFRQFSA
ncbi:MAG: cell division protein FtsA [bacterium]|nr:cell division protein FtsA [bacterium]